MRKVILSRFFFCFHLRVLGCVFVVAYAFVVAMFKHKQRSRASDKCWKCVGKVWRDQEMVCLSPPFFHSPATSTCLKKKVGDLVQVFHGTGAYVEGRNTVSYIGRIVGYNEALGKWEVNCLHLT